MKSKPKCIPCEPRIAMKKKMLSPMFIALFILTCFGFAQSRQDWPQYVSDSIWMPKATKDARYSIFQASYQVVYRAHICYPAKAMIADMVQSMTSKGWKRLEYDPLNPGRKLTFTTPSGAMSWSGYPWTEYWRDKAGNIIFYQYSYDIRGPSPESLDNELQRSCSLIGAAIYYPSDVFLKLQRGR